MNLPRWGSDNCKDPLDPEIVNVMHWLLVHSTFKSWKIYSTRVAVCTCTVTGLAMFQNKIAAFLCIFNSVSHKIPKMGVHFQQTPWQHWLLKQQGSDLLRQFFWAKITVAINYMPVFCTFTSCRFFAVSSNKNFRFERLWCCFYSLYFNWEVVAAQD